MKKEIMVFFLKQCNHRKTKFLYILEKVFFLFEIEEIERENNKNILKFQKK